MSSTRPPEPESGATPALAQHVFRAAVTRPWRLAFVVYATALTTGTHWPRLELGPQVPATDKTIHLLAFGGLTVLLWRTGWIKWRWMVALVVLAWATLDEISQGIPILHRHVAWEDALADALGVTVAVAWLWALAPVGGTVNRQRLGLGAFVFDALFARRRNWMILIGLLAACVAPVALVWPFLTPTVMERIIIMAAAVGVAAGIIIPVRLLGAERQAAMVDRPCFECATKCGMLAFDERGLAACPTCGAQLRAGQWIDPPGPRIAGQLRLIARPAIAAGGVIVLVFLALAVSATVYDRLIGLATTQSLAARTARFMGQLPDSLTSVVDRSAALLLFAVAVRSYRVSLGRYHDRAARCAACGHDLRGTPTTGGLGRCGECGLAFGRTETESS